VPWKPDYCTTAELKSFVSISDAGDDAFLALAITAASRAVDQHTGRQFGQVAAAETRRYTARWSRPLSRWVVVFDDLQDVTGLAVTVTAGTVDVFELQPVNAVKVGKPYERLLIEPESAARPTGTEENEVTMLAKWGWIQPAPVAVKEATLLQGSRLFARRTSPYGVAGSTDFGTGLRLLSRLDPDVAVSLRDYIRWWAAA
jgi:hypothetical protein